MIKLVKKACQNRLKAEPLMFVSQGVRAKKKKKMLEGNQKF